MKTMILFATIVFVLTSCSNKGETSPISSSQQVLADTAGLAEYQAWKQQNEQLQPIVMEGTSNINQPLANSNNRPILKEPSRKSFTKIIYRDRLVEVPKAIVNKEPAIVYESPTDTLQKPSGNSREAVSRNDVGVNHSSNGNDTSVEKKQNGNVVASVPAQVSEKKNVGWSKAAKGTAIGAASGAVLGAIVSKNKALGAVIGGVVGGAGGYAIGRSKDKKDGRYLVENK